MATRATRAACLVALGAAAGCRGVEGPPLEAFSFRDLSGRELAWSPEEGLRAGSDEARRGPLVIHVFQPDCPSCRRQAGELQRLHAERRGSGIVGVAHRLDADDVRAFSAETGAEYPLLLGAGSAWAERWARGDSLYIADRRGRVVYSQVGFHPSDVERWEAVLDDLAAGRTARCSGPERDALVAGERLPAIDFPLVDGRGAARLGVDEHGALVVEGAGGRRRLRAAIGFFSRY